MRGDTKIKVLAAMGKAQKAATPDETRRLMEGQGVDFPPLMLCSRLRDEVTRGVYLNDEIYTPHQARMVHEFVANWDASWREFQAHVVNSSLLDRAKRLTNLKSCEIFEKFSDAQSFPFWLMVLNDIIFKSYNMVALANNARQRSAVANQASRA